jgi:hypothetical protein
VFAAHYLATGDQNLPTPVSVPIVASPEDALAAMGTEEPAVFIGDGAVRYASQILQQVRATPVVPPDLVSSPPVPRPVSSTDAATASEEAARPQRDILEPPRALAPFIARLGERLAGRGEAGPPHALQPLYVRRPDAVLERQRRHGA